jgi:hypothetical protein
MAVLVIVVRVLVVLFLVRLGLRLFAAGRRARPAVTGTELVRDRICNTFLPRERAVAGEVAGRIEHFCSVACRDRALGGSAGALDSQAAAVQSHAGDGGAWPERARPGRQHG